MRTSEARREACPHPEQVSLFVDGEADADVRQHMDQCDDCRKVADAYSALDETTRLAARCDDDLVERIKDGCRYGKGGAEPMPMPTIWQGRMVRYAAAIVVTGVLAGLVAVMLRGPAGGSEPIRAEDGAASPAGGTELVAGGGDSPGTPRNELPVTPSDTILDDSSVRLVGGMHGRDEFIMPVPLPAHVRHVWAVDAPVNAATALQDMLPDECQVQVMSSADDGETVVTVLLSDRDLQRLVDALSKSDYGLISPLLPQPRDAARVHFSGRPVRYEATLVTNEIE